MIGSEYLAPLPDREVTSKQAKIAMVLAVAVHLGTFLVGIFSPYLLTQPQTLPEVYTVNLVAVSEPAPSPAPKPKVIKKAAPVPPTIKTKPAPAVIKPAPVSVPPKTAISTRPIRRKTVRDQKAVESLRRQFHAEQKSEEADKEAKKAVANAVSALRQSLHTEPRPTIDITASTNPAAVANPTSGSTGEQVVAEAKRKYFAAVYEKIKEHFILPDLKTWKPDLQSIMVIVVRKDGIVSKNFFEQKSENIFFNQAVERALSEAAPMPPFPPELKESRLEFGLRFRPGDLL